MVCRTRAVTLAALFFIATAAARADDAPPLDLATVPAELRSTLPGATVVKLPTGQNVTVASLQAAHAARLARLEAIVSPSPVPAALRQPIGSDFEYFGGGIVVVPSMRTPAPAPARRTRLELAGTGYAGRGWAAPYVNFCSRSNASVCLFEPGPAVFALNYPSTGLMSDLDPYLDEAPCAGAGGIEVGGYCTFVYPMSATVRFDPGSPPVAEKEGACPAGFVGKIDPKGIVTIAFDPKGYDSDSHENAAFPAQRACVLRIYEPAATKPKPKTKNPSAKPSRV